MANLSRYDPLSVEPFEDLFRGVFRPLRMEGMPAAPTIKIDVEESDSAYTIKADIPGAKKEDIHVQIDGNSVSISAEIKRDSEVKEGSKVLRTERYRGSVARSFSLGSEIDEAQSEAKYADGVLSLTLPKKAGSSSRKLTVR